MRTTVDRCETETSPVRKATAFSIYHLAKMAYVFIQMHSHS